ncbi:hypothetical protein WA158_006320 [Blastocystis sp. Blastoise]
MEAVNYVNKLLNDASFQESTGSYREALRSYHLCHVQLSKLISLCKDENYKVLLKEKINFVQSKITSLTTLAKQNVSKTVTTIDPITKFPIPVSSIASATNRNPSQSQQNKQDGIQFAKSLPSVPKNDVKLSRTALVNRMNTVFDMNMDKNYSEMELSMRLDILNKKAQEESMLQNYLNRPEETAEESLQRILDQQKLQKEIKMRMTPEEREELERKRKEEKKKRKEERKKKREEKREKKENKHLKQDNKQSIDTKSTSHSTKKHHFISSYLGDSIDSDSTSTGSSDSSDSESIISSDSSDYEDEYSSSSSSSSNSSSNDTDDYSY